MSHIELQNVSSSVNIPSQHAIQYWVEAALMEQNQDTEVVVRIVDEPESASLNQQYRHKQGATNILSFPAEIPEGIELDLLGDLVVCAPVLAQQAQQQKKALEDHWAHIIIHGILHLQGYDHIEEGSAEHMESLEIKILKTLDISNPYEEIK